ncbi:DMT family transporter [Alteromonas sp. H39]|uniref:DMT family transporter n=1 Tax=Alteromonas sp. H39 TaxID=3389876 RepID=UPI0039E12160
MTTFAGFSAIFMWGLLATLSVSTSAIPSFQLLFICFFVSFLLLLVKRMIGGTPLFSLPTLSAGQWLVQVGSLFGFHWCYFQAIRLAPAIEVSLIAYLWPLLLGIFVANSGNRLLALAGGAIGFTGTTLLLLNNGDVGFEARHVPGYLLAATCALIWSGYSWFLSASHSNVDDIGWVSLAVAILALVFHGFTEATHWDLTAGQWLSALLLGLGPVGGAFYLWDIGMKQGNRAMLASLSFTTPVISSMALFVFDISPLNTAVLTALSLILVGALIANLRQFSGIRVKKRRAA